METVSHPRPDPDGPTYREGRTTSGQSGSRKIRRHLSSEPLHPPDPSSPSSGQGHIGG